MDASRFFFFFFNDTATTEIYTLSLHDALPIWAARAAGLPAIDAWLRLRQARVTRDTAVAFRLLADLPAPAAREAGAARAQALLAAGASVAALEGVAPAGPSFDLARLALAHRDSSPARDA